MKINHIAIYTKDLERLKRFYVKYFNGTTNSKYINKQKHFESYFISFSDGAKLEIMQKPGIPDSKDDPKTGFTGFIHLAMEVGSKEEVNQLTEILRGDGYKIIGEPRTTGDGCYESVVLDPDGNLVEIVF